MVVHAYSRLRSLLHDQNMTVPELHRRMSTQGTRINLKSLYRLSDDRQPLQRLDMRVAGALCQVFDLPLSDLITFEIPQQKLRRLTASKQKRLDALMAKNNEGTLTKAESEELKMLVRETEEIMLANARQLAEQRRQLAT